MLPELDEKKFPPTKGTRVTECRMWTRLVSPAPGPRGHRDQKKRPGVDFFAKDIFGGLTN